MGEFTLNYSPEISNFPEKTLTVLYMVAYLCKTLVQDAVQDGIQEKDFAGCLNQPTPGRFPGDPKPGKWMGNSKFA